MTVVRPHRPPRLLKAGLALVATMALSACESTRPFERSSDGTVVYLDQLSDAQKATARADIVRTLDRGLDVYDLQIGDEFEVFFDVRRKPTVADYAIAAGDKLSIDFLNDKTDSTVVLVRPDGRISVPLIGPIAAAGKTADALAHELERRYAGLLSNPQITVNLTETHSALQDLIEVVGPSGAKRSITDKVLPDGTISLPLLPPIPARGRTLRDVQHDIDAGYTALHFDMSVSLVPRSLHPGTVMVLGEVAKPGRIDSDRPQTVLMAVAQAGGVLTSGSLEAVRVFYIGSDETPHLRSVNLKDEINDLRLDEDMILPSNSVIYVPPTELAKTGRFLDSVLRDILRFQGFSIGGTFLMNNPNGGTTVVPSPTH